MKFFDYNALAFAALLTVLIFMLGFITAELAANANCLAQGYPQSSVTYRLDTYCLTQEGAIVPRVIKQ